MSGMVIIGAGECGARAAMALREADCDGPITLIGDEPHDPYERPPLTKPGADPGAEQGAADGVVEKTIVTTAALADAGITFMPGRSAAAIDRAGATVTLTDGTAVPYVKLLLATGARPRTLPFDTAGAAKVLRTLDDAHAVFAAAGSGSRVVIIGAGLIGLELAATLRAREAAVTVLEAAPHAMQRAVLPAIAEIMVAEHRRRGVVIEFAAAVQAIAPDAVTLADGRAFPADLIVAAIGVVPETHLAAAAGLAVDNGIAVDAHLGTDDPHIFAAGDCCAFPLPDGRRVRLESWRNAQQQGTTAARNMLGLDEAYTGLPWYWSDQYDLGLQVAGLPDPHLATVRRDLSADAFILFQLATDGTLVSASGLGPGRAVAKDVRLAEMMMERGVKPPADQLTDPAVNLKRLLRT